MLLISTCGSSHIVCSFPLTSNGCSQIMAGMFSKELVQNQYGKVVNMQVLMEC